MGFLARGLWRGLSMARRQFVSQLLNYGGKRQERVPFEDVEWMAGFGGFFPAS